MTDQEIIRTVAVELFGGCRVEQDGSVFIDDLNGPFLPLTFSWLDDVLEEAV